VHVNGQDDSALPYMNSNTVTSPTLSSYNPPVIHNTMRYKNPLVKDDDDEIKLHKCRLR